MSKLKLIKKLAQEMTGGIPLRKKGPVAAPAQPIAQTPTTEPKTLPVDSLPKVNAPIKQVSNYSASVPQVKTMQKAIIEFANIAAQTDVTSLKGNQQGQQHGEQSRALPINSVQEQNTFKNLNTPNQSDVDNISQQYTDNRNTKDDKEYLGGSDPFGNFIVQNYIPKDSHTGKQYLNVDVSGNKNRESSSMDPKSLRGIIDSMKRVGSPGAAGEKVVDGIWQTRTNNALHVIKDLVSAMLNFTNDMKLNLPGFTSKAFVENLTKFKSLIPNNYTDIKNPGELAEQITPYIQEMTKFFTNLKSSVFENADLRQYIDQKVPFAKYTKVTLPDNLNDKVPGLDVTFDEISNLANFKKFVEKTMGQQSSNSPEVLKDLLSKFTNALKAETN